MTAAEIAARLTSGSITQDRVQKLAALCARAKVSVETVLAQRAPHVRAQVEALR